MTSNYGKDWQRQRERALERDDYSCVECGKGKQELGREPSVHHILPYRVSQDNSLNNLVSVCFEHHQEMELTTQRFEFFDDLIIDQPLEKNFEIKYV